MQLTEQLTKFEALNTPIGKAVMLTVGIGVGDVVKATVSQMTVPNRDQPPSVNNRPAIPPLWTGVLLAWGLLNVKQVSQWIGPETAEIMAAGILADSLNDEFKVSQKASNFVAGLFGKKVESMSAPVLTNQTAPSVNRVLASSGSSDRYGGIF